MQKRLRPDWTRNLTPASLRIDLLAGLTNAAVALPQGIAFATIAGLPPEFGLYTSMVSAAVAAIFGSSLVMVSGATTVLSALLFSTLSGLAPLGSADYVNFVLVTTFLTGLFQCMAGAARLGRLVSFISHSVLVGFTAVAAVLIGVSQLSGALGVTVAPGGTVFERLYNLSQNVGDADLYAALVAGTTLVVQILVARYMKWLPSFLIALIAGTGVAWWLGGAAAGIRMIEPIAAPFPAFTLPTITFANISLLAPGAAAIALLGLLEAITIGRAFALRRGEDFDANREVLGQGLSNIVGSVFQSYASSGSFTRSGVNYEAGARTPLSAIVASAMLAVLLVAFSDVIVYIPYPAIAGLILYVSWRLIQYDEIRHIVAASRADTTVLGLTVIAGLLVSLEASVYVGAITSFAVFLWQSARPDVVVTVPASIQPGRRKFRNAELHRLPQCPQLLTLRLDGPLYFASVDHVYQSLRKIDDAAGRPTDKILVLKGGGSIDLAGADLLINEIRRSRKFGRVFSIVALYPPLIRALHRYHVIDAIGEENLFVSKGDAVEAAIGRMKPDICASCTARVFLECRDLPSVSSRSPDGERILHAEAAE